MSWRGSSSPTTTAHSWRYERTPISTLNLFLQLLKATKPCSCGAPSCRKLLADLLTCQGPLQCSSCQNVLLHVGQQGKVPLHPTLALPVCRPCKERVQGADWSQGRPCRWPNSCFAAPAPSGGAAMRSRREYLALAARPTSVPRYSSILNSSLCIVVPEREPWSWLHQAGLCLPGQLELPPLCLRSPGQTPC